MPKLKSHKGLLKRVKITGRGKLVYHKGGRRHLLGNKSRKHKRALSHPETAKGPTMRNLRHMLLSH
jgi:large subunit ribosomal protein L35